MVTLSNLNYCHRLGNTREWTEQSRFLKTTDTISGVHLVSERVAVILEDISP
jgi:hypothetical protein